MKTNNFILATDAVAQEPEMAITNEQDMAQENMNENDSFLNQILSIMTKEEILTMDYRLIVPGINELLQEFETSEAKEVVEKGFEDIVKVRKPKDYFLVPFILERSENISLFYVVDVENYKFYRRKRRKSFGGWCGMLLTLGDGSKVYMCNKRSRDGWIIYTENLLREFASYNSLDASNSFENLLMSYLLYMKDLDCHIIKHPNDLSLLANPRVGDSRIFLEILKETNDEVLKDLPCALGRRVSVSPEVDVYNHWSNLAKFYSIG